jgi:hypothetical protein
MRDKIQFKSRATQGNVACIIYDHNCYPYKKSNQKQKYVENFNI